MKRTIAIASCLAALCLTALVVWVFMKPIGKSSGTPPVRSGGDGQASDNAAPGLSEKTLMSGRVFELPVQIAFFGDDQFSPCYVHLSSKTIYRWKGVVLRRDQVPNSGPKGRIPVLNAENFSVVPIEAPVKYREFDGEYRPGYLDRSGRVFYEWKGIVLTKQQMLDKGQDGQNAVAERDTFSQVIEIDMPAHLMEKPGLWKKI